MKYFPFAKNAMKQDSVPVFDRAAQKKFDTAFKRQLVAYLKHLDKIADRLGAPAYKFFRFGFAEASLHDGFLLSFNMGDRVVAGEKIVRKLRFGREESTVRMLILNYAQDMLHVFEFRRLRKVVVDIPTSDPIWFKPGKTLGQIYSYEVVAISPKYLRVEWLLDSGGEIIVEFEKLIYRGTKVAPSKR
ncbi:MAG: hypothetical protein AB7O65_02670 [Candidatus Korobacteraceae bacterium]